MRCHGELAGRNGQRLSTASQGGAAGGEGDQAASAPAAYAPPLVSSPGATGSGRCVYAMSASLATVWLRPRSRNLVVSRPSTPTGPRAWIRAVLMPTCRELQPSASHGGPSMHRRPES